MGLGRFSLLQPWLSELGWALLIAASIPVGWWACTVTARNLGVLDPSAVVWDEVVAFWLVLWLVMPTDWQSQLAAFALFRFFDAVKPGPVGWADRLYHDLDPYTNAEGLAPSRLGHHARRPGGCGCTLLVVALGRTFL